MRSKVPVFLSLAYLCTSAGVLAQTGIAYVDINATGNNDGTSWADAFTDLQSALPTPNPYAQVWVAQGRYTPAGPNGNRAIPFHMDSGTAIYGGFKTGGSTFAERNIERYETILSGDLNENDIPEVFQNNLENSYHVITGNGTDNTAILDGFTISGGNANAPGSPIPPDGLGGGLIVISTTSSFAGDPTIRNCTFKRNQARVGAGAESYKGNIKFEHCTFIENNALNYGGGLHNNSGGSFGPSDIPGGGNSTITDCRFVRNTSFSYGAGASATASTPQFTNCEFVGNAVTGDDVTTAFGGGLFISCKSPNSCTTIINVTNCTFVRNTALNGNGGGIANANGPNVQYHNCIFWRNQDAGGMDEDAQIFVDSGSISVDHSSIDGLVSSGPYDDGTNIAAAPDFLLMDYGASPGGVNAQVGNAHVVSTSPTIDAGNNTAIPSGVTTDRDGVDRTLSTTVDMGPYEFGFPYVLVGGLSDTSFHDHAFTRFIDPSSESSDGVNFDRGIDEVTLVFSEQVRDVGESGTSDVLSPASLYVLETGGGVPPTVTSVCRPDPSLQTWSATVTLSRPITVRQWTSIVAVVEDMDDNPIDGSDRVIIGFLPGDVDQDGVVGPLDLLRFRQYVNGVTTPSGNYGLPGTALDYIDTDGNGVTHPFDLLLFRQLINGITPSTQVWNGAKIDAAFPLCCR